MNYRPEMISTGKYAYEVSEYLASRGHEVEVITTAPHYPGWRTFPGYRSWTYSSDVMNGVMVRRAPMYLHTDASGLVRLAMPLTWVIAAFPLLIWRTLRRRPDVIVCVQPTIMMAPAALLAAKLVGARTVQHVQDLEIDTAFAVGHVRSGGGVGRLAYAIERLIMRRFDRIVTISLKMRDRLVAKGVERTRVSIVRNWVDTAAIRPLGRASAYRAELGIAPDQFVVQYSGQMGRKQALHLIVAAAEALANDRRFVFVLAGDGPTRPDVERQTAALPNVRLLPLQSVERLGEFLNLADCHVLPQDAGVSELVLPSKLGGMLASGKPILITAHPDSELAGFLGDAATFTPPGDAMAIAAALRIMIDTPDTAASKRLALAAQLEADALLPAFEQVLTDNLATR